MALFSPFLYIDLGSVRQLLRKVLIHPPDSLFDPTSENHRPYNLLHRALLQVHSGLDRV